LSRRQKEVLAKLVDIYHEDGKPVHKTALAKRLGVIPVSAYEMLRLLEEYGMVESEYQRSETPSGPGRPMVAFHPSILAIRQLRTLAGSDVHNHEEWRQAEARILQQVQNCQDKDFEQVVEELLDNFPDESAVSLPNLANITTAIVLNLNQMDEQEELTNVQKAFSNQELPVAASLSALIGLGIHLAISKRLYYRLGSLLLSRAGQILSAVVALNPDKLNRLAELIREVSLM
ncbi:MAG: hypothetical protein ABFD53_10355, partial [Anaerolineaceae bacterium]